MHKANKGETLQDLVLTNTEENVKEVKIRRRWSCNNQSLVMFVISRKVGLVKCGVRIMTLNFRN